MSLFSLKACTASLHACCSCRCSRKILWLRVSPSNHDPKVIARFFLECVEEVGGMSALNQCRHNYWNGYSKLVLLCFAVPQGFPQFSDLIMGQKTVTWLLFK